MAKKSVFGKLSRLLAVVGECGPAAVAFSGGVDSSLVAAAAAIASPGSVAFTVDSPSLPREELSSARRTARATGIRHVVVKAGRQPEKYYGNHADRCYHCKRHAFSLIIREAKRMGLSCVMDGSNADDAEDHEWGMKAARELSVRFPLVEAGIGKGEAREIARELKVPSWDKPASACLASRIASGEGITGKALQRVEEAEKFLKAKFGLKVVRVRVHGDLARVQVGKGEMGGFLGAERLRLVAERLKTLGFKHVCIDAEGYVRGK
ncbi:Asparagine synthase [uncultured archaeon]|nr:Asparagine synthase [uncultured archaeon]